MTTNTWQVHDELLPHVKSVTVVHPPHVARFAEKGWYIYILGLTKTKFYEILDELQANLDVWLVHYNTERPHQGYRNMGRRPIDTINEFLKSRKQIVKEEKVVEEVVEKNQDCTGR